MKIAYVGLPAHGHTNPSLPVVKALVARGHQVDYYNAAFFRDKVARTGVDFRPLPEPLPTEREIAEVLHEFINASLLIASLSRRLAHYLIDEWATTRPDLVIYDSVAMWGYIAARTHEIPAICFITTFVLDGSQRAVGLRTLVRFFWSALPHLPHLLHWRWQMAREFGRENAGGITEYADLNLVFTSRAFHPENTFIDQRFHFVGPAIDPATRQDDCSYGELGKGKKVYISLGTVNNLNPAFYRATFAAFAEYPAQFVMAVGPHVDLDELGAVPANYIVRRQVPQLTILQQVDAFITHGGMNSVHEALYYGVPLVVVPNHFEQLLNGKRVAEMQAGILLATEVPSGEVSAAALRAALDELLQNQHYRQRAGALGETLRDSGGYLRAADLIEQFAQERG